jgi:hypothetical protein
MTPVIFRVDKEDGGVLAVFPDQPGTPALDSMLCYAHVGQHSHCTEGYVRQRTRPASEEEAADLLRELRGLRPQPYDDLIVRRRISRRDYETRRERARR